MTNRVADLNLIKMRKRKTSKKSASRLPISESIKNWTAIILGFITVGAGIWGIFGPVMNYLQERKNQLTYSLNDNMIMFVNQLRSDSGQEVEEALIMLMYYEKHALPILYYKLEKNDLEANEGFIERLVDAINIIYSRNNKGMIKEITARYDNLYNNLFRYDEELEMEDLNSTLYNATINYTYMLGEINLSKQDKRSAYNFLVEIDSTINSEPETRTDHMGALSDRISISLKRLELKTE
jgi:hypothetical protein